MSLTIDASVLVAAARPQDPQHDASRAFLRQVRARRETSFCPILVLAECAAAVARRTGSGKAAARLVRDVERLPRMRLVEMGVALGRRAAELAGTIRLRGADSTYVAVAESRQATLITWDAEMLDRAPAVVPTMTPTDWMASPAHKR